MNYNVIPTPKFKKEAKRLTRKYASLKGELANLSLELANNPAQGTSLGNNSFKLRLAIKSKGKGKSGGARVITYIVTEDEEIYLLTIYDKSEIENVSDRVLKDLISQIK